MWEEYNIRPKRLQGKFRRTGSNVTTDCCPFSTLLMLIKKAPVRPMRHPKVGIRNLRLKISKCF